MNELMQIGELARRTGLSAPTIRYYEQLGLLRPVDRQDGGYRFYDETALFRLEKTAKLKGLGLSLEEIASVIELYCSEITYLQAKKTVLAMLQNHLAQADARIADLGHVRDEIAHNIQRIEDFLAAKHHSD